jgi:hypothetical protein
MYHEWGRGGMYRGYWWESQKERDHWEDQGVCGLKNIKMVVREICWDGTDRIDPAKDRDQWSACRISMFQETTT